MLRYNYYHSIDQAYKDLLHNLTNGEIIRSAPRGMPIRERIGTSFVLTNPRSRLVQNPERKLSLPFQLGEFLWIMCGHDDVEMIAAYNKRMADFSDDGKVTNGAYGGRLRNWGWYYNTACGNSGPSTDGFDQIENVLNLLKNDRDSRQALLQIFDPGRDLSKKTKDVPCNVLMQFFIRNDKLHLASYVRSNDIVLGFPYDTFHWTLLQELIANELGLELGKYYYNCGSLHLYENNLEWANRIEGANFQAFQMNPVVLGASLIEWLRIVDRVEVTLRCKRRLPIDWGMEYLPYSFEKDLMYILGGKLGLWETNRGDLTDPAFRNCLKLQGK